MSLMMLATGSIVGYGYLTEVFMAWYGGNPFEEYVSANRAWGPYWWVWWGLMFCNIATVQRLIDGRRAKRASHTMGPWATPRSHHATTAWA